VRPRPLRLEEGVAAMTVAPDLITREPEVRIPEPGAPPPRRRMTPLLWTILALVAAVVVGVGVWALFIREPAEGPAAAHDSGIEQVLTERLDAHDSGIDQLLREQAVTPTIGESASAAHDSGVAQVLTERLEVHDSGIEQLRREAGQPGT
jgi:hypothetical protein